MLLQLWYSAIFPESKTMFKSRIPLQTPIVVKLLLSSVLIAFLIGWSFSSETSSEESPQSESNAATKIELKDRHTKRELARMAKSTHQKVNEYRLSLDLAPLKFDALISDRAKIHSENMAQQIVEFSHDGFQGRVKALEDTIDYRSAAENVAYNMGYGDPVETAVAGWIKSNGHRTNMEGDYNLTGVGVAVNPDGEYYFTQIFILEH